MQVHNMKRTTDKTLVFKYDKIQEELCFVFHEDETIKFISKSLISTIMRTQEFKSIDIIIDEYERIFEGEFTLSEICEYIGYRAKLKTFEGYMLQIIIN
jgi:hypothetical protein